MVQPTLTDQTGESRQSPRTVGDEIFTSTINLEVKVTRDSERTIIASVIELIERAR